MRWARAAGARTRRASVVERRTARADECVSGCSAAIGAGTRAASELRAFAEQLQKLSKQLVEPLLHHAVISVAKNALLSLAAKHSILANIAQRAEPDQPTLFFVAAQKLTS